MDVGAWLTVIQVYAANTIVVGVAVASAWMGWKFILRFVTGRTFRHGRSAGRSKSW